MLKTNNSNYIILILTIHLYLFIFLDVEENVLKLQNKLFHRNRNDLSSELDTPLVVYALQSIIYETVWGEWGIILWKFDSSSSSLSSIKNGYGNAIRFENSKAWKVSESKKNNQ